MNDWSDRILDSFLDEIISGETPPDLTNRILSRLKAKQTEGSSADIPLPEVPHDSSSDRSWWQQVVHVPPVEGNTFGHPAVVRLDSSSPSLPRLDSSSSVSKRRKQSMALALGIAACVLAIISLVRVLPELYRSDSKMAGLPGISKDKRDLQSPSLVARAGVAPGDQGVPKPENKEKSLVPRPERLDIKGLPFAVVQPDAMPTNAIEEAGPSHELAMTDEEIIQEIDQSFVALWDQNQVKPAAYVNDKEWLARTASVLLNVTPTTSQLEVFEQTTHSEKRKYLLQQATSSERFSRQFAKQFVSLLVPQSREESSAWREEFELWLTQNIAQRTPYSEIVYKLITADKPPQGAAVTTGRPESYWLNALQDSQGHMVAKRVSNLWLNQALQCSQCHDQGSGEETSQAAYWSLVAALNLGNKPEYFFERKDGTLQAAIPAFPDGKSIENLGAEERRVTFAKWLIDRPQLAEGAVNMTWQLLFGAPLVPNDLTAEDPSFSSRASLLKRLAQQFRVHRYDLPRLVLWISSSQPFASPSRIITQRDWLLASEVELRTIRTAENLFASYRRLDAMEDGMRPLLPRLVQAEREEAGKVMKRTVLAQPMPKQDPSKKTSASLSDDPLPAWQQNLRLHASPDSDAAYQSLITRLLKTQLSWPQLVAHALGHEPNSQELRWADELLQYHGGDRQVTLLKLHWTTQQGATL